MRIAFFGDSYTEGTPFQTTDPEIWPNLIGKHLNAEVDNQYASGGSNRAIFRNICRYFQNNTCDLAIVMWSHYMRNEIHVNEEVYQIQPNSTSFPDKFVKKYYRDQNENAHWHDFIDHIWAVEKIITVPHFQGCCFPLEKPLDKPKNWFTLSMWEMMGPSTPCGHPEKFGHKNIYEYMVKHLQRCNLML